MAVISRTNLIRNPGYEYDLALWSVFGGASISRVSVNFTWRMRLTFPTASAGVAGVSTTVVGLTIGKAYRLWMSVPSASGTTTVQMEAQGVATGAAIATNGYFAKEGGVTFTATATSHTINLKSAVGSTSGDWVDVEVSICEEDQGGLPPFDGSFPGAYWAGPVGQAPSVFANYDTSSNTNPWFIVEFDARPVSSFDFVLDRNALDDATVALIDSPRWWHVTEAEKVDIRRGRQTDDQALDTATAQIVLRDYDGDYDPDNAATPLQINGMPVMRAGMRIRVSVLVNPLGRLFWEPLFVGSLQDVTIDRTYDPTTTVSAVDDLAKLKTSSIPPFDPPIRYGDMTFWRTLWALGFAGIEWDDFTTGANMLQRQMLATTGGGDVLSELQKVVACEGGKVYVQRDGHLHVGTHADDFATNPAATLTDNPAANSSDIEYKSISTSTSIGKLINRSIVTRGDYSVPATGDPAPIAAAPPVTGQDDDSVALNERVWSETLDAPLLSDSAAQDLADWRATRRSRSATQVDSVSAQMNGQSTFAVLDAARLDLSSVIRVRRFTWGRGIDGTYSVEGIDHSITDQTWDMTVYTSPLDISTMYADQPHPFFLDTSALDGADVMASY